MKTSIHPQMLFRVSRNYIGGMTRSGAPTENWSRHIAPTYSKDSYQYYKCCAHTQTQTLRQRNEHVCLGHRTQLPTKCKDSPLSLLPAIFFIHFSEGKFRYLFVCVFKSVYNTHAYGTCRSLKRPSDLLEQELKAMVSHPVGAGN